MGRKERRAMARAKKKVQPTQDEMEASVQQNIAQQMAQRLDATGGVVQFCRATLNNIEELSVQLDQIGEVDERVNDQLAAAGEVIRERYCGALGMMIVQQTEMLDKIDPGTVEQALGLEDSVEETEEPAIEVATESGLVFSE